MEKQIITKLTKNFEDLFGVHVLAILKHLNPTNKKSL
jgi:hypothetical protein